MDALHRARVPVEEYLNCLVRCEEPSIGCGESELAKRRYGHHRFPRALDQAQIFDTLPGEKIDADCARRAVAALCQKGWCVLRGVMNMQDVHDVRSQVITLFEEHNAARPLKPTRLKAESAAPSHSTWTEIVPGRFHLDGWRLSYTEPSAWLKIWAPSVCIHPLVRAFFRAENQAPDTILHSGFHSESAMTTPVPEIRCHDLQAIVSVPGSSNQSWHADNASRGLTVAVALCDILPEHGPTQIWPHAHTGELIRSIQHGPVPARVLAAAETPLHEATSTPVLRAGDALVFDSRMLHRGLANSSAELRPIIVWQFTNVISPPPGQGAVVSVLKHSYMRALQAIHSVLKFTHGALLASASANSASDSFSSASCSKDMQECTMKAASDVPAPPMTKGETWPLGRVVEAADCQERS